MQAHLQGMLQLGGSRCGNYRKCVNIDARE